MHHDPDGLLLVRDADVGLRHARLCVARAWAAARTLRSARPGCTVCGFDCVLPWTIPVQVMTKVVVENMRPPTQPVRQARPNWPNVSTQTLTGADNAAAELSPRCGIPLDQRAQKALVLAE